MDRGAQQLTFALTEKNAWFALAQGLAERLQNEGCPDLQGEHLAQVGHDRQTTGLPGPASVNRHAVVAQVDCHQPHCIDTRMVHTRIGFVGAP